MYTAATSLPTLNLFQWSNPTYPIPTLASSVGLTDTTLYFTAPPLNHTGAVITGNFLMGIKDSDGYTELIYVPSGKMAVDGLSATDVIRGVRLEGLDYTTSDSTLIASLDAGSEVFCAVNAVQFLLVQSAIQGLIKTGSNIFDIGSTAGVVTIKRNGLGFCRYDTVSSKAQFSNDGTNWVNFDNAGVGVLTAGTGITFPVAGTIQVDATYINSLITAAITGKVYASATDTTVNYLTNKLTVTSPITKTLVGGGGNEHIDLGFDVTVFDFPTDTGFTWETISSTNAVAELPINVKWYSYLTDASTNLGDANARRKYAMKIIPGKTVTGITAYNFRAAEKVNGATALGNLVITIQTDNAGAPSGTVVTNSTATISQVTQRTWNVTQTSRNAATAGAVALVKGTTYWLVFECSATDVTNYLVFGDASSYDENYLIFTRLTYDLDTTSWGSSSTVLPLFFWFTGDDLGTGLIPTDARYPNRAWNFKGFSNAGYTQGQTCVFYTDTLPNVSGNYTPMADYYLTDTPGAYATTPGTTVYKIAFGESSTWLKMSKGQKRVSGYTTFASTTTTPILTWFRPSLVTIRSKAIVGGTGAVTVADGYGVDNGVSKMNQTAGAIGGPTSQIAQDTTYSWNLQATGGGAEASHKGTVSAIDSFGFTLSNTKTNSPGTAYLFYEATA